MGVEKPSFDENVALVRAGYEAFNRGDVETLLGLFAPEVTWQRREVHPAHGTYRGRSEVARDVLGGIRDQFAEITFEPLEIFERGEHIVVRVHQRGRGRSSGAPVEGELVHVLRLVDGSLAELRAFSTMEDATAALEREEDIASA
jgi:ketosteroid isomerase-like protein